MSLEIKPLERYTKNVLNTAAISSFAHDLCSQWSRGRYAYVTAFVPLSIFSLKNIWGEGYNAAWGLISRDIAEITCLYVLILILSSSNLSLVLLSISDESTAIS